MSPLLAILLINNFQRWDWIFSHSAPLPRVHEWVSDKNLSPLQGENLGAPLVSLIVILQWCTKVCFLRADSSLAWSVWPLYCLQSMLKWPFWFSNTQVYGNQNEADIQKKTGIFSSYWSCDFLYRFLIGSQGTIQKCRQCRPRIFVFPGGTGPFLKNISLKKFFC